jgi:hypothetical protein
VDVSVLDKQTGGGQMFGGNAQVQGSGRYRQLPQRPRVFWWKRRVR